MNDDNKLCAVPPELAVESYTRELIATWDERIRVFRKRALKAKAEGDTWQYNRWRAVVDTTVNNRLELMNALEEDEIEHGLVEE